MTVTVNLTGNEEVPPVQTEATGVAEFTPMGMDSIGYTINATNIEGATAGAYPPRCERRKRTCSSYIVQI
jgi:CHRD domain